MNGMNCSHCKACVEKAVRALDGVISAEADVAKKELRVEWHDEDVHGLVEQLLGRADLVDEAGFEFVGKV